MDYRTLFISDLTSHVIYMIALCALAVGNRRVRGLRWFAACLLVDVLKVVMQSLRGFHPLPLTTFLAVFVGNELNDFSFIAMYLGYRWFLLRQPLGHQPLGQPALPRQPQRSRLGLGLLLGSMALYGVVLLLHTPWIFFFAILPVFVACVLSVVLLLRTPRGPFFVVSRVTAAIFGLQILVMAYRTVLITLDFSGPNIHAPMTDPRWLVSMMLLTMLDSCFVATFLWFYVVELQATLRHQARTDNLTGALNRRALDEEAEREISRCRRQGLPLSLIVLDIDHFKILNDARGHDAGDIALRSFVSLLSTKLRSQDWIGRSGGEEFMVLLPETPMSEALEVAERMRAATASHAVLYEGQPICITASLGVAVLKASQDSSDSWESLRRRGDLAMYTAKRHGRNCVVEQIEEAPVLLREPASVITFFQPEGLSSAAHCWSAGAALQPHGLPPASASQSRS